MNRRICKKILKFHIKEGYTKEGAELGGRYAQTAFVNLPSVSGKDRDLQTRALGYLKSNVLRYRK